MGLMSNLEEILISFETCCKVLAEEEFEKSDSGQLPDAENALIQGRNLLKEHLARCVELAGSDHIGAKYGPGLQDLVKRNTRGTHPTEEELERAGIDLVIVEFYRHMFGPDAAGGSSPEQAYPDWQTAIIDRFKTKQDYLRAIEPITEAYKRLVRERSGLDSYLNVLLTTADAYERAAERMFDVGSLIGRYLINSELLEERDGEYKSHKVMELNHARALAGSRREAGFAYIDQSGDLAHSYHLDSSISKSDGETITSRAGDLTPVLLVPHTYAEYLNEPSVMAVIDFGRDRQCRLKIIFQSKTSAEDRGAG